MTKTSLIPLLVVVERDWAGLSNIVVSPLHRRKGAATRLIGFLADWARDHGGDQLYLQVVRNNVPAVTLYKKLDFSMMSRFHYRIHPTGCESTPD